MNYELKTIREEVINLNRVLLLYMTKDERILFFERVSQGYCQTCGKMTDNCNCQKDE